MGCSPTRQAIDHLRRQAVVFCLLAPRRHFQLGADMLRDFDGIEIYEMTEAVVRDAPEFRPIAQGADRGFPPLGENPAETQAGNISELAIHGCEQR